MTAVGDDSDLKVLCQANDVLGEVPATEPFQKTDFRVRYEDLCDLIAASEVHHGLGNIATAKDPRLDLETPREAKVLFYGLSFVGW